MLKRKITRRLEEFYQNHPSGAMMIIGARQVGKSFIIEEFARKHYQHLVKMDFIEHQEYISALEGAQNAQEILLRMSSIFGDEMVPGKTLIFFDEVQEYKELITQIKYLIQEGSYDYILSGSLLGTVFNDILSAPVGYLEPVRMYPLDLEEFAWANGIQPNLIDHLRTCYESRKPVDSFIHQQMMILFELYLIVGGMPAAVQQYLETKNLRRVAEAQLAIIALYKQDITKYDHDDKLYLNEIFELIPSELNAKNKRFILKNLNENVKFAKYNNSFLWLKNAGVALPAHLAEEPSFPLILSKSSNLFKLFSNDVGLLAAQYGGDIQLRILRHEISMNFGAIYENMVAQELSAHGFPLYYYNSKKYGELDFLIEQDGSIIPIEVKSGKDYYRHRAINNILELPDYHIPEGLVFCNGNTEVEGKIIYYPIYLIMFLQKKELPDSLIYAPDFSSLAI